MKIIRQFGIIMFISLAGEIMNAIIPLPIPAGIYGIILMFVCLKSGFMPIRAVKKAGSFLIEIMPLMFIPAAVGIVSTWKIIKPSAPQYIATTVISTVIVMLVSGLVTQWIMDQRRTKKK